MSNRWASLSAITSVVAISLLALSGDAGARSTYCSPSGDLCYGALGKGANVRLRISLFAGYFTRYRLCVKSPNGKTDCRRFRLHRVEHGIYESTVRWAKYFPDRGPGVYRASWRSPFGRMRPDIDFREGPSISTRPKRVKAGERFRVFGLAGGCLRGSQVTLLSQAFPPDHEFAGIPAALATVDGDDSYSTSIRIPSDRRPGRYTISARCGGANFGVTRSFVVQRP